MIVAKFSTRDSCCRSWLLLPTWHHVNNALNFDSATEEGKFDTHGRLLSHRKESVDSNVESTDEKLPRNIYGKPQYQKQQH